MKQIIFIAALMLLQCTTNHAQPLKYLGLRAEISSLQLTTSEDVTVKKSNPFGIGLAFHYPFNQTWEMTVSGMFSFYNFTGDARNYSAATKKWTPSSNRTVNVLAIEADYTVLHGLGEAQRIKFGGGVWYGFLNGNKPTLTTSTESWGSNADPNKNYQINSLFKAYNYGVLLEGLYNVNDALQFSVRYKLGLGNLYKTVTVGNTASWKQSSINLGVVYYFGGQERGTKNPTKDKNKDIDFN
jgi:hypothetical protein